MTVFDTEGNGLRPDKFYVISYQDKYGVKSLTNYKDMRYWLLDQEELVGHNIQRWDVPHLERVLEIEIKAKLIDTLALSWYLYPNKKLHGLEYWGEEFGVPKPVVTDWQEQPLEVYVNRCEEDVKINQRLWEQQKNYLAALYETDVREVSSLPIVSYLRFKLDCAVEQEKSKWKLDVDLANNTLGKLYPERDNKLIKLAEAMPKVKKYAFKNPPAKPYKKDGTLSVEGAKWQALLRDNKLPPNHDKPVQVVASIEEPNPGSTPQLKDWLFGLGWKPATFKYEKEEDGSQRVIPQIQTEDDDRNKTLCPSVLLLAEVEPAINHLAGLFVIRHRISILEGFLKEQEDGFVKAEIQGLTNTLRFKHKTIVNLPGVEKLYGKELRGCLIAKEGNILCGADMSSLEDMTKRHYMYDYDPEFVEQMSAPGFDPHLDLALFAGAITSEDLEVYKENKDNRDAGDNIKAVVKAVKKVRKPFKVVNYSATYGVGKDKLSRTMGGTVSEAALLLDSYWKRNWSIKQLAEDMTVKTIKDQMWLYNPVSKFWYSLRFKKDIFSTLNQGTGVYCFDSWIGEVRRVRKQLTGQFHDEGIWEIPEGKEEAFRKILLDAIDRVNARLKLNVTLGIGIEFGKSYADIH